MYRTIQATAQSNLLLSAQAAKGIAFTLANNDTLNPVWVGPEKALNPGASDSIQVPPLGSTVISGDIDTYIVAQDDNHKAQCFLIPGTGGWSPSPAQVAAQLDALGLAKDSTLAAQTTGATIADDVADTGVPLLSKSDTLGHGSFNSLNQTLGPFAMTRPSYEIFFNASTITVMHAIEVEMTWTDSVSGQIVCQERWSFLPGSAGNPAIIYGKGPGKGDTLTITVTSNTIQSINSWAVLQNSRIYDRDDWESLQTGTVSGFTNSTNDIDSNILASQSPNVANGSPVTRLLPLYSGAVSIQLAVNGAQPAPAWVEIHDIATDDGGLNNDLVARFASDITTAANGGLNGLRGVTYLPRGQCSLVLTNKAAATQQMAVTIVKAEQPI